MHRLILSASFLVLQGVAQGEPEQVEFRFFGSLGSETHVTPSDSSSFLNPENFLAIPALGNSADFTLFADLAPADKAWKFRCKLRAGNEWTRRQSVSKLDVGELSWSVSATPWLDLQVGRSIEKWGTGYAWNPTGVVNPRKNPADPNDRRGAYRGVDMVRADLFVRDWNLSLLAVPEIDWEGEGGKHLLATGWAFRAYRLIGGVDLSISASGGGALPNSQGFSVARLFGDALELHAEVAAFQDGLRFRPTGGEWTAQRRRFAEILIGGQYTFPHNVNLVLEYFHSGHGLSADEWSGFGRQVETAAQERLQGNPLRLLEANLQFAVLTMGRDYGFGRLYWLLHHDKLELELLVLSSLRDGSALVRPGIYWKLSPNWRLYWLQGEFAGAAATEFGYVQVRRLSDFGLRYHF
jgi:hypothetical protein